jgi:hypothetical protein
VQSAGDLVTSLTSPAPPSSSQESTATSQTSQNVSSLYNDNSDVVATFIRESEQQTAEQERAAIQEAIAEMKGRVPASYVAAVVEAQMQSEAAAKAIVDSRKSKTTRSIQIPKPSEVHQAGDVNYSVANASTSIAPANEIEKAAVVHETEDGRTVIRIEYRESPGSELYDVANPHETIDPTLAAMEPQRTTRDSMPSNGKDVFGRKSSCYA